MKRNCQSPTRTPYGILPWKVLFPFGIWQLWFHHNNIVFCNGKRNENLLTQCIGRSTEFFALVPKSSTKPTRVLTKVKWFKPVVGGFKLKTDGSARGSSGLARGGGLIRNNDGNWFTGFARAMRNTCCEMTELWALKDGLTLALQLGIVNLTVEINADMLIFLLNNHSCSNLLMEPLLSDCRNLLLRFSNPVVNHIFREANQCADALAKLGAAFAVSFVVFDYPLENLLAFNKAELFCNRWICS